MAYWSVAVLLLSISFLAYKHPPSLRDLPTWLQSTVPAKERGADETENGSDNEVMPDDEVVVESEVKIAVEEPTKEEMTATVKALTTSNEVWNIDLDEPDTSKGKSEPQPRQTTTLKPLSNGTLKAPSMAPPPRPISTSTLSPSTLMPPPTRPTSNLSPNATSTLRIPSTGPLPNRGLPANSQQRVSSSSLAPNGFVPNSSKRGKVLLSPGHSPMDWAALTRSSNLSGVSTFQRVTPSTLKTMTGRKGKPAWSSWQGKVYNITPYLPFHPGGEAELMKAAGRDGTKLFMEIHPWVNWENMLGTCLVGVMVPENHGTGGPGSSSLEDMD